MANTAAQVKAADHEQTVQILQFRNNKLSEQLAVQKEQIKSLDSSTQKYEAERKKFADTLLCVNRIWQQFSRDIQTLCKRNAAAGGGAAAGGAGDQQMAEGGDGDDAQEQEEQDPLVWDSFDPFLARLLQGDAASSSRLLKKHTQGYLSDLSAAEEGLHARAAGVLEALGGLLDAIEARSKASAEQQEALRALAADEALATCNQQLQEEVQELQDQLTAATALQRSTNALLKKAEDRAFEATKNATDLRNELADREVALQAAHRKLERARQAQQQPGAAGAAAAAGGGSSTGGAAGAAAGGGGAGAGAAGAAAAAGAVAAASGEGAAEDEAAAAAAALQELQAQVAQLQGLLEARTAEKDQQVEAVAQLQRELEAVRARSSDEAWVPDTNLYKLAQQQLAESAALLEARCKQLGALQHERDELQRHLEAKNQMAESERVLRSQVLHMQQQVAELNQRQVELLGQKQQMQLSHQQELSRYSHVKTSEQLTSMLAALQKEVDTNTGHARKAAEASAAADTARQEALALRSQLTAAHATIRALQARLQSKSAELQGLSGREDELKERLNDLSAFVEVLTTVVSDAREVVEVRRSEAALKAQLADTQAKLKGDALQQQLSAAVATESELRRQLEEAVAEAAKLRGDVEGLRQQVAELQQEVANKQQESEAFAAEIGDALSAFEQQRQQNAALLQQLTDRDAALNTLKADKLAAQQQLEAFSEQLAGASMRVKTLEGELNQAKSLQEAAEKDSKKISSDLAAAREQLLSISASLDSIKAELKAEQDGKAALQVLCEQERSSSESRKQAADRAADELRHEAAKRQRLEDTNKQLAARMGRLNPSTEKNEEVDALEEENRAMRKLLVCSVCDQRQKNVIIRKCNHMFCSMCTDTALASRNRQCPSCGHKYSKQDVENFYFT